MGGGYYSLLRVQARDTDGFCQVITFLDLLTSYSSYEVGPTDKRIKYSSNNDKYNCQLILRADVGVE